MQRARKSYGWTDQEDAFYSKSKIDLRFTTYDLKGKGRRKSYEWTDQEETL